MSRIERHPLTVGEAFELEAPQLLRALPAKWFDSARLLEAKVDTKARICSLQSFYSVPVRLARARAMGVFTPVHEKFWDAERAAMTGSTRRRSIGSGDDLSCGHGPRRP